MNFELSEDQQMLVETVTAFVRKESPVSRLRKLREDETGWSKATWRKMGEFGWLGAAFPESVGGAGGSFVDAALILEQLGTTLVPEPFAPSLVAGRVLLRGGDEAQQQRWLAPMLAGQSTVALGFVETRGRHDVEAVSLTADAGRLTGEKRFVLNGHAADQLILSARADGDLALFVVDRDAPGLTIQSIKTMDGHHAATVRCDGVEVGPERRLGGHARAILDEAMDLGAAAACAEGVGIMRTVLQMTAEYLRTREQFGVKIGTFQALQHRAVDMFIETELARSSSLLAAIKADDPDEDERMATVSAAKAQLAVSGRFVTQQAIQLHGGIGITDEHDVGLYFKRMQVLNTLYGDEEHHVARYSALPSFAAL